MPGAARWLIVGLCLLIAPISAWAEEPAARNSIWIDLLRDSSATEDIYVDLNLQLGGGYELQLGAGKTTSPPEQGDLATDAYTIGFNSDVTQGFFYGARYQSVRESGAFEIDTYGLLLGINAGNWVVRLRPEYREISLVVDPDPRFLIFPRIAALRGQRGNVEAHGLDLLLSYEGGDEWWFSIGGFVNDYTRDLSRFNRVADLFAAKTLSFSAGLAEHGAGAAVGYSFAAAGLELKYDTSQSTTDGSRSDVVALRLDVYGLDPYGLTLEAGAIDADTDAANHYFGLSLGYFW